MVSLNILFSDPHNFLKEVKEKLGKNIRTFFVTYQKFSEILHGPSIFAKTTSWPLQKSSGPPLVYLMLGPLEVLTS